MDSSATTDCDDPTPVDAIPQAFLAEHRSGLQPDIEVYCQRHSQDADALRPVLSAALLLEAANPTALKAHSKVKDSPSVAWQRRGDYRIVREAGRGGMGVVYEAIQESLARRVALKTLPHTFAHHSIQLERYQRERRAVSSLHHTNIVPVFAVGEDLGAHDDEMTAISARNSAILSEQVASEARQAAEASDQCVRLFDARTSKPVVDLPTQDSPDIDWLAFSPDSVRLAVTRPDRDVLIWDLHSLRNELAESGISDDSLPEQESNTENHQAITLDCGPDLLPPNRWWSGHDSLARFEALQLNFPDAIDRMDKALEKATQVDSQTRAGLLIQRELYHLLNHSPDLAAANFSDAVTLWPQESTDIRLLVNWLLLGPSESRDMKSAANLLIKLTSQDESIIRDRLYLALALIRLSRLQAARDAFEKIGLQAVTAADAFSQFAYQCERCYFLQIVSLRNDEVLPDELPQSIVNADSIIKEARIFDTNSHVSDMDAFSVLMNP